MLYHYEVIAPSEMDDIKRSGVHIHKFYTVRHHGGQYPIIHEGKKFYYVAKIFYYPASEFLLFDLHFLSRRVRGSYHGLRDESEQLAKIVGAVCDYCITFSNGNKSVLLDELFAFVTLNF